jgi:UDP-N-acetylmuramoyl-tripeptide--D-alanyl-D-alanine ligase
MIELSDLLDVVPATVLAQGPSQFRGAAINSRSIVDGDLFFALPGRQRDGHDFVGEALDAGAGGAVVARPVTVPGGRTVVQVPDTLQALQLVAKRTRRRFEPKVIAVTGSVGKTTTKNMIAEVLRGKFSTLSSTASYNNHLGVPLTLSAIDATHSHVISEIGTNRPGEIAALTEMVSPDIGVVTNIGFAHIGNFGDQDAIAKEKTDLLRHVRSGGTWVVNGDDHRLVSTSAGLDPQGRRRLVLVGMGEENEIRAEAVSFDATGTRCVVVSGRERVPLTLAASGKQFVYAALFAVAVGEACGIDMETSVSALSGMPAPPGRSSIRRVSEGVLVIDDSYNASPDATLAGLDLLGALTAPTRIAVLGQMLELGDQSRWLHRLVGEKAAGTATHVVGVGAWCEATLERAKECGIDDRNLRLAGSATEALDYVREILKTSETECAVLVKGSRFTHMERVVLGLSDVPVVCSLSRCTLYLQCSSCANLAGQTSEGTSPTGSWPL